MNKKRAVICPASEVEAAFGYPADGKWQMFGAGGGGDSVLSQSRLAMLLFPVSQ